MAAPLRLVCGTQRQRRRAPATARYPDGPNYLAGTHGDDANAVLAAASCNSRRLLE